MQAWSTRPALGGPDALVCRSPCEVPECGNGPQAENATCPSAGRQLRLRRARFDSHGYQVDGHLRPRVEGAG
eukprot:scaffold35152_cov35-Phaeocystis_antarctica.AAC.1